MVENESIYVRDDDNVDQLLSDIHETANRLRTLFEDLSRHTDELEAEIKTKNRPKGASP